MLGRGGFSDSGPFAHFLCFRGKDYAETEEITRLRNAAERVAQSHGLEIFDVQLRREPIGMVLRVVIDRPDPGGVEAPEDSVGIADCQRVSQDLSALLDVEDEFGETTWARPTRSKSRRRGWIARCGTSGTTGASRDGSRRS